MRCWRCAPSGRFDAEAVTRIVVRGNPLLAARTDRPNVTTGREAQVSVQHSVAAAAAVRQAGLAQYTDACVRDPAVLALRAKVEVEQDDGIPTMLPPSHPQSTDGASAVSRAARARQHSRAR